MGRRVKNVFKAAQTGDKIGVLYALRDRVARELSSDEIPSRDIASLSKRLIDIIN